MPVEFQLVFGTGFVADDADAVSAFAFGLVKGCVGSSDEPFADGVKGGHGISSAEAGGDLQFEVADVHRLFRDGETETF